MRRTKRKAKTNDKHSSRIPTVHRKLRLKISTSNPGKFKLMIGPPKQADLDDEKKPTGTKHARKSMKKKRREQAAKIPNKRRR